MTLTGTSNHPGYTATLTATRSVMIFYGATMSGFSQVTVTTSPQQAGTPCTANFTTTGTR